MFRETLALGLGGLLFLAAGTASAQQAASSEYIVGPHDVLNITVFNEPTLSQRYTVEADGSINFPLIQRVQVGGKTLRAIQEEITSRLAAGYLVNPQVTILVDQFRSQSIFVLGEVRQPGKHVISGDMTLLEALSQAGGPTANAGTEVLLRRPKDPSATAGPIDPTDDQASELVARVSLEDLQSGRAPDVIIRDGDNIFVPKAEMFFVTGYVRSPGPYVWEEGMTVLVALSKAGGITERGAGGRVRIIRIVEGERKQIGVEMTDLVLPDDTVEVPQRYF
jgi:polysaccharide export outer membrane protein